MSVWPNKKRMISALFIIGKKCRIRGATLRPYVESIDKLNKRLMARSIRKRKYNINLNVVLQNWRFSKILKSYLPTVVKRKCAAVEHVEELQKNKDVDNAVLSAAILQSDVVSEEFTNLKHCSDLMEEKAAIGILALPNLLHEKTPFECETVHFEYLRKPDRIGKSHIEIGADLLTIQNPYSCVLMGEAALFEYALQNYFQRQLLDLGYIQFSPASLCLSVLIEGCGANHLDGVEVFNVYRHQQNDLCRIHLVGNSSLYSMMVYFTKRCFHAEFFPINCFSLGRVYQPFNQKSEVNLFNLSQFSAVQMLTAHLEHSDIEQALDNVIEQVVQLYKSLGYHFRLVLIPATNLKISESLKISIQMFSNYRNNYVEVGSIVHYGTYLSKRLIFVGPDHEKKFPKVIHCNLINIHRFIGCVLENNFVTNSTALMTPMLKDYL